MALTTYTGEDANFYASGLGYSTIGASNVSVSISRDTIEQPLVCEKGNFFKQGAQTITGSFDMAKLASGEGGPILASLINGGYIAISGMVGPNSLHYDFHNCMITGFDLTIGDATSFTTGSIDWQVRYPYNVTTVQHLAGGGTLIKDY